MGLAIKMLELKWIQQTFSELTGSNMDNDNNDNSLIGIVLIVVILLMFIAFIKMCCGKSKNRKKWQRINANGRLSSTF